MDALKAGATDFVAKERPARLVPALCRAVKEGGGARRPQARGRGPPAA